jgi:hypothetical protein
MAYPPSPQELGSVTFNAADTATAASAFEHVPGYLGYLHLIGWTGLTCVTSFTKDLQPSLCGERLRTGDHSYGLAVRGVISVGGLDLPFVP